MKLFSFLAILASLSVILVIASDADDDVHEEKSIESNEVDANPKSNETDVKSQEEADEEEEKEDDKCAVDFLEDLTVEYVVGGESFGPTKVNSTDLELVTALEVKRGSLEVLCENDLQFRKLSYLKLSRVKLQELKRNAFKHTRELREINLKFNQLTEITDGVFSETNLVVINLEGNKIKHIAENAFDNMPLLESVDLDQNKLTELNPNWFTNTPNMHYITLNFNDIKKVPKDAFKYINEFDGVSIYLVWNQIDTIEEGAFGNFKEYGRFQLDHNKLENISMDIFPKTNHTFDLSLYGNQLACMPDSILHNIASSCRYLDLRLNPFEEKCLEELESYKADKMAEMDLLIKYDESRKRPYNDQ